MNGTSSTATDVRLLEVGPRDGLQNEETTVPTATKLELIGRLVAAGVREVEATSFVSPEWIPQLADGDEVARRLPVDRGVRYSALVPNSRGYERFRKAERLSVAAVFISASETHNRKNVNRGIADHLERLKSVIERCLDDDVPVRAYISTIAGCPYEGEIAISAVAGLVGTLGAMGVHEIALGDTIGVGVPAQIREIVDAVALEFSKDRLALHVHDTYGRGLANVWAGYEAGLRNFDASLGGLGGCPYAPGAAGNVATEDVVSLFESAGVHTGIDLEALVSVSRWLETDVLQRRLGSRVLRAMDGHANRDGHAEAAGPG